MKAWARKNYKRIFGIFLCISIKQDNWQISIVFGPTIIVMFSQMGYKHGLVGAEPTLEGYAHDSIGAGRSCQLVEIIVKPESWSESQSRHIHIHSSCVPRCPGGPDPEIRALLAPSGSSISLDTGHKQGGPPPQL